jgi:hypothetical protein
MRASICTLVLVTAGCLATTPARPAENATGIYLLGSKTSMAGFVPPPGTYVTDYNYYYSGSASGAAADGVALRRVGNVTVQANVDVDGNAFIDLPTVLWVVPEKVLGGNLGLGVIVPMGGRRLVSISMFAPP